MRLWNAGFKLLCNYIFDQYIFITYCSLNSIITLQNITHLPTKLIKKLHFNTICHCLVVIFYSDTFFTLMLKETSNKNIMRIQFKTVMLLTYIHKPCLRNIKSANCFQPHKCVLRVNIYTKVQILLISVKC